MPPSLILLPADDKHDRVRHLGSEIQRPYRRALRIGSALVSISTGGLLTESVPLE
jgi:hypothetical protein